MQLEAVARASSTTRKAALRERKPVTIRGTASPFASSAYRKECRNGKEVKSRMNGVRIASSHVGQGVFATQSFKRYDTIGQVQGRLIEDPEYGSNYCIGLNAKRSLEPEAPFR
jgi:hypothetical protein